MPSGWACAVDKPKNRVLKCRAIFVSRAMRGLVCRTCDSVRLAPYGMPLTNDESRRSNSWICLEKWGWSRSRS